MLGDNDLTRVNRSSPPDYEFVERTGKETRELSKVQQATTPEAKRMIARDLERLADDTKGDAKQQYVLLDMAAVLSAEAEAVDEAMLLVDRIESLFEVNGLEKKAAVLVRAGSAGAKPSAAGVAKVLAAAQRVADEAMTAGEVGPAADCIDLAIKVAERAKDPASIRMVNTLKKAAKDIEPFKAQYQLVRKADERLAQEPENPKANAVAGAWHCFVRGDWTKGLPYLAKADEATLAALAKKDQAGPTDGKQQIEVGDGWWDLSKERKGLEQYRLQCRAVHWYEKALKLSSGSDRVQLLNSMTSKGLWHKPTALKFNGKSSSVTIENFSYDGSYPITLEAVVQPAGSAAERSSLPRQTLVGNLCDTTTGLALLSYHGSYAMNVAASSFCETQDSSGMHSRPWADNRWVHVAGVYDGREVRTYVDGVLQGRRTVTGMHKPSLVVPFVVGASHTQPDHSRPVTNLQEYFLGAIRGVRISGAARYQKDFKLPERLTRDPATLVLYQFSEGKGAKLLDASNHKRSGTIIDAEWTELAPELRMAAHLVFGADLVIQRRLRLGVSWLATDFRSSTWQGASTDLGANSFCFNVNFCF